MKAERTVAALARRLATAGAAIEIDETGRSWLALPGHRCARPGVDPDVLKTLRAQGAIEADGSARYVLSPAGRAMVRRLLLGGDHGRQHGERTMQVIVEDGQRRAVTAELGESPLAWLRSRKGKDGAPMIDADAFDAGERLRADFTRGQLMPRITANWGAAVVQGRRGGAAGGMAELTEAALSARLRVEKALAALGPELSGTVLDFCCFLKGLEQIEQERQWPKRSAKLVLQLGLAALARHYGLSTAMTEPRRSTRMRSWRSPGEDDGAEPLRPPLPPRP